MGLVGEKRKIWRQDAIYIRVEIYVRFSEIGHGRRSRGYVRYSSDYEWKLWGEPGEDENRNYAVYEGH